jgi:3-methylcrotonyl-CoA carboxylase alpha subunit
MARVIKKILIANRAEIASRVMATCRLMGIETVAIYSRQDRNHPFVAEADYAFALEGETVLESYLNMDQLVAIAKRENVDAIHPGYGFLSENAEFARRLKKEKIGFIGPNADTIELMGDKKKAKEFAERAGLPMVPGYHGDQQDPNALLDEANKIGYPLLIKATAGGGGKGMKIVWSSEEFLGQLDLAKSEAAKSFGNDQVILERYIEKPRHIEVQVFGDGEGAAVHLFERECSVQRRYQKIIEESPSPYITDEIRKKICDSAVQLAKESKYLGAGTIEFIVNEEKQHYFLEMNTRLQVEHPVTETVTGLDLVRWQIEVACGNGIPLQQSDIVQKGHGIECRIYAENPGAGFLPTIGTIGYTGKDKVINGRADLGVADGVEVGLDYDPMIAKLIVWDENRILATEKMKALLEDYPFLGLKTNREFLLSILEHQAFLDAEIDTNWVEKNFEELGNGELLDEEKALASLCHFLGRKNLDSSKIVGTRLIQDPWESIDLERV